MKKIFVLLTFISFSSVVFSQLEIYSRNTFGGHAELDINIYGERESESSFALTYFALIESEFAEGLVGFNYYPVEWMAFGLSAGVETSETIYRFAGSYWMARDRFHTLLLGEKGDGRDNYFYKTDFIFDSKNGMYSYGAVAWRYHGIGPILKYNFKADDSNIWIMPARDFEFDANRIIVGIDIDI